MVLVIISFICSLASTHIGGMIGQEGADFFYVLYGVIGFLTPIV